MIKKFEIIKLDEIMNIWLNTNLEAHDFINESYWHENFEYVKAIIPKSEVYVYADDNRIKGFVGIVENRKIAGIFVLSEYQNLGIGTKLLDFCKKKYSYLEIDVYTNNGRAVDFYKRNDFLIKNTSLNADNSQDEYVMTYQKSS